MKRSNKLCFGLLSVLFTIFGLFLLGSSDVSALKYSYNYIDFGDSTLEPRRFTDIDGNTQYGFFTKNNDFLIVTDENHPFPSSFRFPHTWRFSGNYDENTHLCELRTYSDGVSRLDYTSSGHVGYGIASASGEVYSNDFFFNTYDSPFDLSQPLNIGKNRWFLDESPLTSSGLCNIYNYAYNDRNEESAIIDSNMPRWDWSSLINIPLVNERRAYEQSKPYTYAFSKLFLKGTDKIDGVLYVSDGLQMSKIFGDKISSFSSLSMNLSPGYDITSSIDPEYENSPESSGSVSEFDLTGSIEFDSDYTLRSSFPDDYTSSPSGVSMEVRNYYPVDFDPDNYQNYYDLADGSKFYNITGNQDSIAHINCEVNDYHVSEGDDVNRLDFKCHYNPSDYYLDPEVRFRFLDINLTFGFSPGYGDYFFQTDGDYKFKDFSIITNNDDTPIDWDLGGGTNYGGGGNLSDAPGYGVGGGGSDGSAEPDWLQSLGSMFQFTFINPFAPIFSMFSDNSSCASIPIISGLIHSNETQVCPWFDSNVRSILTPVLGLSSMMLVFGFAVRWLGSSSGNLFEDSGHIESPGYTRAGGVAYHHGWRLKK